MKLLVLKQSSVKVILNHCELLKYCEENLFLSVYFRISETNGLCPFAHQSCSIQESLKLPTHCIPNVLQLLTCRCQVRGT